MRILTLLTCLVTLQIAALPALAYDRADFQAEELAMDAYFAAGDWAGAEAATRRLIANATAAFGPESPEALNSRTALANTLRQQDRTREALAEFRAVYDIWLARYGEWHPGTLKAGMSLAITLSEAGDMQGALPLALESVRIAETTLGRDHITTTIWRYSTAGIFSDLGYLDEALAEYRRALPVFLQSDDPQAARYAAIVARQIGRTEADLGHRDAAADALAEAIPLFEKAFGPRHPEMVHTLNEYGLALWRSGRRDDLPALVQKALALSREVMGEDSLPTSDALALQVLLDTAGGPGSPGWADALQRQREVIAMRQRLISRTAEIVGRAQLDLAAMLADTTDPAQLREAWTVLKAAQSTGMGSRNFAYDLLWQIREAGAMPPAEIADALLWVTQDSQGSAAANATLKYGQRLALGEGEAAQRYRSATDLTEREARLQEALLVQAQLPLTERDAVRERALRDELAQVTAQTDALWQELQQEAPGMSDLIGGGRLTLADLQAMLAPDEALLIIDVGPHEGDRHIAMAISATDVDWQVINWTADSFPGAVSDTRAGIALRLGTRAAAALEGDAPATGPGFDLYAAHWLYAETLAALEPVFAGKENLYFDLRGAVAGLPPQLLVVAPPESEDLAQADWLIRHHAVTVLPSVFALKTIALARGRPPAPEPLLAFGDPVYDLEEGGALVASLDAGAAGTLRGALAPLPETADEVRAVAEALGAPPAAVRTGAAASEAALKEAPLDRFRVLHFATHGLVTGDVAGQTVLGEPALALTPGRGEDGFLTVSEILSLRLNADWVVLSACNTAVGNDPDAEALSGLAQAFFYAGARSLMVSHWPVESRSAAHLMTETFRIRAANPGMRAAEAQRQAILGMIDDPSGRWVHPAYWAPFVLVGSPD